MEPWREKALREAGERIEAKEADKARRRRRGERVHEDDPLHVKIVEIVLGLISIAFLVWLWSSFFNFGAGTPYGGW